MKKYFEAKTEQLQKEVGEIISAVDHDGLRGQHAENVLAHYLREVLPSKYRVDTGLIYGISNGSVVKSKQTDIIIHDDVENPPLQVFSGFKIFPAECVYAAVSVKITVDTNTLLNSEYNAFDNIKSVKTIPKNAFIRKPISPGVTGGGTPSETLGIVFGFNSKTSLSTLTKNIDDRIKAGATGLPDLVCVLNSGNIAINPSKHELTINNKLVDQSINVATLDKQALMIFTSLLVSLLNRQTLMPLDFFRYAYLEL